MAHLGFISLDRVDRRHFVIRIDLVFEGEHVVVD